MNRYKDAEEVGFFESKAYTDWWDHSVQSLLAGGPVEDFLGNILIHPTDFEIECEGCEDCGQRGAYAESMLTMVEERASLSFWKAKERGLLK